MLCYGLGPSGRGVKKHHLVRDVICPRTTSHARALALEDHIVALGVVDHEHGQIEDLEARQPGVHLLQELVLVAGDELHRKINRDDALLTLR